MELLKRKGNSELETWASWKQVPGEKVMALCTVRLDLSADLKVILLWQMQIFA